MKARGVAVRGAANVEYLVLVGLVLATFAVLMGFSGSLRTGAGCLGRRIAGMSLGATCGGSDPAVLAAPVTTLTAAPAQGTPICTSRDGCVGTDNCFTGETPVETPNGSARIDSLVEGDVVVTKDPERGETGTGRVTQVHRTEGRPVVDIVLRDGRNHHETITATPEHPFWVIGQGWKTVSELAPLARVSSLGGELEVESLLSRAETAAVYNLEIAEWHVFTVGTLGAVVHNTCAATERARQVLGLDTYQGRNGQRPYNLQQRLGRLSEALTLPAAPATFGAVDTEQLAALSRRAADAWERFRATTTSAADRTRAAGDYFSAVAGHLAVIEQARAGGDLRFDDQGRVREVRYPNGTITTITRNGVNVASLEIAPPGEPPVRLYYRNHGTGVGRNRFHIDTGRGENDPEAFRGWMEIGPAGHITRHTGPRDVTTAPDGTVTTTFTGTEYHYLDSTHAGGLRITVSQADNGVRMSVRSTTAGNRTELLVVPIGSMVLAPRIVREENGLILVSLDGTDTVHAAVHASLRPWGEGLAARDRHVPYYDAANLRVVMRALPSGTEALTIRVAINEREHVQTLPTPLPNDANYILAPRWTPGQSGTWRGSLEARTGWWRGNQFVADTTQIGRQTMNALEMQVNGLMRLGPIGSVIGLGEAIVGTELSGRWMTPGERAFTGVLSVLGLALDFGPAASAVAQEARALTGIQTALGVTRAEARGLLQFARNLPEEQLVVLRQVARGESVAAARLERIVERLRGELARLRVAAPPLPPPTTATEAAATLARAEARVAAPVLTAPAGGAPATLRQARQLIQSGHGAVHVPAEGADPIVLAAGRLSPAGNPVANNTVFRHGRHGEQLLRGVLDDFATEIAALTPGGPAFRTTVQIPRTLAGFHSVGGGTPVLVSIREVQVTLMRGADGMLRLTHFAPQAPAHLAAVMAHQRAALDALKPGERLVRGIELDATGAVVRVIGQAAPAAGTSAVRVVFQRRADGVLETVEWVVVRG